VIKYLSHTYSMNALVFQDSLLKEQKKVKRMTYVNKLDSIAARCSLIISR